jgi:hypothetical protein
MGMLELVKELNDLPRSQDWALGQLFHQLISFSIVIYTEKLKAGLY